MRTADANVRFPPISDVSERESAFDPFLPLGPRVAAHVKGLGNLITLTAQNLRLEML